ncbi:hypothetical protein B0T26DRAFT_343172 [Lasiosphaeria miniovina]|uniref:Uncharacterized protein n=1 Tax=Lasiosphaeria miniovina TaxID=1954250 RepID=A0AA40AB64_9PEZI|nr:uncharacterized protein B0T26DRAFT_343172 [Lasiosphaeria miniovina]KAK0712664.1 hypothetical protein B0T26DRAFT_343172 [Lasiosphaeria miniovina]
MADSPLSTPKRKRTPPDDVAELDTTTQFTFDLHSPLDDGSASPRTRVAHRFRGLALDGGGGVSPPSEGGGRASRSPDPIRNSFLFMRGDLTDGARKRMKLPEFEVPEGEGLQTQAPAADGPANGSRTPPKGEPQQQQQQGQNPNAAGKKPGQRERSPKSVKFALDTAVVEQSETIANTSPPSGTAANSAANSSSSASALSFPHGGGKSQTPPRNKRAGTPPAPMFSPQSSSSPSPPSSEGDAPVITDPLRASLTWHDDEITIYDPDDSDDDGTGINGIGFKPTPAIAHARILKRRQQLAEYRKREEREARAKRSQRRRGSPSVTATTGLVELRGKVERRRVRFMESATELIGV